MKKDTYKDDLYNFISLGPLRMSHNFLADASNWFSLALLLHVIVDYFVKHASFSDTRAAQQYHLVL